MKEPIKAPDSFLQWGRNADWGLTGVTLHDVYRAAIDNSGMQSRIDSLEEELAWAERRYDARELYTQTIVDESNALQMAIDRIAKTWKEWTMCACENDRSCGHHESWASACYDAFELRTKH